MCEKMPLDLTIQPLYATLCINPHLTTYRHDYIDRKRRCLVCVQPEDRHLADLLEALNARAGATQAGLGCSRWTSPAPIGCRFETRITPNAANIAEDDNSGVTLRYSGINACMSDRPNRFLRTLWKLYPAVYEQRLKEQQTMLDRQRQINRTRVFSTYQVDFGGMAESPLLAYDCLRAEEGHVCDDAEEALAKAREFESFGHWQARDRLKCI